ncbi:MAG: undecaprenyl-diphosphatase UppP [bacterium]
MELIHSIILGIVEGITEFLPISSTAHLIIAEKLLKIEPTDFSKSFIISIQLGAILSVVVLYWKKLLTSWENIKKIIIAFIPTAIIGFVLYQIIKDFLMESLLVIALALLIGGIVLIVFEKINYQLADQNFLNKESDLKQVTYKKALLIGIIQALAVIPGVSRSAATIIGGLSMNINRQTIVEFSFLLAVPTMLAATIYDLIKNSAVTAEQSGTWLIGFIVSFIVAMATIKFLVNFIKHNNFISFGIYRIIIGLVILGFIFF